MFFYEENNNRGYTGDGDADSGPDKGKHPGIRIVGMKEHVMVSSKGIRSSLSLLLFLVILTGCKGFSNRSYLPTLPGTAPADGTPTPTTIFTLAAPSSNDLDSIPAPNLFDYSWTDRFPYKDDLVPGARSVLNERFDRSVYHLMVNIAKDYLSMTVKEEVLYTNHEDSTLDKIVLRMYPAIFGAKVTYHRFLVDGVEAQPVVRSNESVIEFPLKDGLKVGTSIVLSIDLELQMPSDPSGNYQVFGFVDNLLTLAHFYPIIAVYDADGWHDETPPSYGDVVYSDTSYYLVEVTLPGDAVLVSSGISKEQQRTDDRQTVFLAGGPMRDFFIAAGSGLEKISRQVGDTTVNSYANHEVLDGSRKALDTAAEAIRIFDEKIGSYPYTEFDVLATSTTALGVEYPGVTVINRTIYQPDEKTGGASNSIYLESTVAHEVGHQWFYNVVGDDQVNQPWLDESLAQYITGLYFADRYSDQAAEGFKDSWYSRWQGVKLQDIPIGLPVKDYDPKTYGAIVYGRGPIFLTTLHDDMGAAVFDQFLKDYYRQNMWENVNGELFMKNAEAACSCDLSGLFNKWIFPK